MKLVADIFSVLFIALFIYALVASHFLRWMIDKKKFQQVDLSYFRSWSPPLQVLTPTGVKIWWSRWCALGVSFVFLAARIYLDTH